MDFEWRGSCADCDFAVNAGGLLAEHTIAEERGCAYAAHFALTHACWLINCPAA